MFISINAYNTPTGVHWSMASVRPAHMVKHGGLYVWHRTGDVTLDVLPVTSRALIQAVLDELQRNLGER